MRPLHLIAQEILRHRSARIAKGNPPNWTTWALPYLHAMVTMRDAKQAYGADSGTSVVAYGLSNLEGFRGPDAKRLKAELREHLDAATR